MGRCKFLSEWLDKKDSCGYKISSWGQKQGDSSLFCCFCETSISTAKGFFSIRQHYETERHKKACLRKQDRNQLLLTTAEKGEDMPIRLYCVKDSAYTAELIWCMKMVQGDIPMNFSQDIAEVFRSMFPTSGAIPEGFSLNPTKVRYLISDALGPHFRKKILSDVGSSYYTLLFDETTNNCGMKELQTAVRFWSDSTSSVKTYHLETFFLGHATAESVKDHILLALNNAELPLSRLLMLGSDGPKVNQKLFHLVNEEIKSLRGKGLVNVGFCNIHMIHNAFQKGLQELGSDASELIIYVFNFFKDWPSRSEDFCSILEKFNLPTLHFIKHVTSRWLTIEPAAQRVLHHWDALIEYFLKFIPSKQGTLLKTNGYKRIVQYLKKSTIKAELTFICTSAALFTDFTSLFQKNEPLIHVLYDHINNLLIGIMGRTCKNAAILAFKESPSDDAFQDSNLLPILNMKLGDGLSSVLAHLSTAERKEFILQVRNHYVAAGKYILTKNVFSKVLRRFSCLNPRNGTHRAKSFKLMASYLPVPYNEEKLMDEVTLFHLENVKNDGQIEEYWSQLRSFKTVEGNLKFPNLFTVVKAALALSHGNAEVERGFSKSARILTENRSSMSVRSLNAVINIKDGMNMMGNKPHLVPITKELVESARVAYKSYHSHLEEEKLKAEKLAKEKKEADEAAILEKEKRSLIEQNQKDINSLKSQLQVARGSEDVQSLAVDELIQEANCKLKKAIGRKDLVGVQVAQAMLEGAVQNSCNRKENRKAVATLERKLDKKRDLITNFFSKKPKK